MSAQLRKTRRSQEESSPLVTRTQEGYTVRPRFDPSANFLVTIIHGRLQCTCTDFKTKQSDPDYACRHIVAVIEYDNQRTEEAASEEDFDDTTVDDVHNYTQGSSPDDYDENP